MSKYKLLLYQSYEKVGGLRWGAITGIAFLYWAMGTEPQEAKAFTEDHKNRHKCSQHCWPGDNVADKWKTQHFLSSCVELFFFFKISKPGPFLINFTTSNTSFTE